MTPFQTDAFPDSPAHLVMFHHTDATLPYIFHNITTTKERLFLLSGDAGLVCLFHPLQINYN